MDLWSERPTYRQYTIFIRVSITVSIMQCASHTAECATRWMLCDAEVAHLFSEAQISFAMNTTQSHDTPYPTPSTQYPLQGCRKHGWQGVLSRSQVDDIQPHTEGEVQPVPPYENLGVGTHVMPRFMRNFATIRIIVDRVV